MAILSPSGLETARTGVATNTEYEVPGWVHIFNKNLDRLNNTLLKIDGLNDTVCQDKKDEAVLVWGAGGNKWVARNF